jgi:hypothetical protein
MMPTKSDPKIKLMMSVTGGGDDFGPGFATLEANQEKLEWMLRQASTFRTLKKLAPSICKVYYVDQEPMFFESGDEQKKDTPPEDAKQLEAIFEDECYPTDGWRPTVPGETPEIGTVRLDYCYLVVSEAGAIRPNTVDYLWRGCIKHTDDEIETHELKEEEIKALLAQLLSR